MVGNILNLRMFSNYEDNKNVIQIGLMLSSSRLFVSL